MRNAIKTLTLLVPCACFLTGCSTPTAITDKSRHLITEDHWVNADKSAGSAFTQTEPYISNFNNQQLNQLVIKGLNQNFQLRAKQSAVAIAMQEAEIKDATDFPELSLAMGAAREKTRGPDSNIYGNRGQVSLDLSWEVDIWGKLSAAQKSAHLRYAGSFADYQRQEKQLVNNIAKNWFNLLEAQQLKSLYKKRAGNLQKNADIIQNSYQLGIQPALDVYLAKSDVSTEKARLASQRQQVIEAAQSLENLLSEYPAGKIRGKGALPLVLRPLPASVPANLLTHRADIRAEWYNLLALDADLAVAHKERFPRFMLTSSAGDSTQELSNLLSSGSLLWSIAANITQPVFNAGRLKSKEEQARLRVVQQEQMYLETVYNAFSEAEQALSKHRYLQQQYTEIKAAKSHAEAAETLAFDQYMRGLVSYTTVLESQRRSFDAQTRVIQLTNQLLQNRLSLYLALGLAFADKAMQDQLLSDLPASTDTPS